MDSRRLINTINSLFQTRDLESFKTETGSLNHVDQVSKIGYCSNLTLDVIEKAKADGVDFILTHHDAWDFIFGLKEACMDKLKTYGIGHYFVHLPLDDADFGTNDSLVKALGLKHVEKTLVEDGFACGRIGYLEPPLTFDDFVDKVEDITGEKVKAWQFHPREIHKVGMVCGGGGLTDAMAFSVESDCDIYLTGEKVLYTIEYAELHAMDLVIGSHTFTELPGVESLAKKVKALTGIEIHLIQEDRLEAAQRFKR